MFDQFIDPENLQVLPNEQHRTVILLLALTGLRVSSLLELRRDALQIGSDDHPYLLYVNAKHKREAALPIGPVLCEQLRRQEEYLQSIYGKKGTALMLPSPPSGKCPSGRGGEHPITEGMVRLIVKGYVRKAEIRDSRGSSGEVGAPASVPPSPRHASGQREGPAAGDPEGARPRLGRDDSPLRARA